ncbi:MAG: asparagine synthetase B [Bacteroidota bacterium]|nr:asparagine synthetase B [Bacteroidota bacterium]
MKTMAIMLLVLLPYVSRANSILIPMDAAQRNHLKAYGVAYYILQHDVIFDWLLNYRGGSFLVPYSKDVQQECLVRGVTHEVISDTAAGKILEDISSPAVNMNAVRLEKAPRIAVYSPKNEFILDETDAVILVLDYAEIPYEIIYDEEVLSDALARFDWLHLHHEDFTGQFGRHMRRNASRIEADIQEVTAQRLGYRKVSEMKLAVARKIKAFCAAGGYLFAMCSGAETFDIALAAEGIDINESTYDGDDSDPGAQEKLDFDKTLAFEKFTLEPGYSRRFSDINVNRDYFDGSKDFFMVFNFSAKWDIIPTMLTQDHERYIREFHGQTTAFNKYVVKPTALILGENKSKNQVRYIYGELERGHWTYYSGHDPEGVPGRGRGPTDLNLFPNSPGYRLILNNVLFPSARKKKQKT